MEMHKCFPEKHSQPHSVLGGRLNSQTVRFVSCTCKLRWPKRDCIENCTENRVRLGKLKSGENEANALDLKFYIDVEISDFVPRRNLICCPQGVLFFFCFNALEINKGCIIFINLLFSTANFPCNVA